MTCPVNSQPNRCRTAANWCRVRASRLLDPSGHMDRCDGIKGSRAAMFAPGQIGTPGIHVPGLDGEELQKSLATGQ